MTESDKKNAVDIDTAFSLQKYLVQMLQLLMK